MAEIIVKYDNKVIERIVTEKKRLSIGRTRENDIVLENRGVSRKHAMIEFNNNAAVIIDNESLNGTFVNNRKVDEEILRDQDTITIGKYSLIYYQESSGSESDAAANFDGTMVLRTKKQKNLLENDRKEKAIVEKFGSSVLVGEDNVNFKQFKLDYDMITIGKAKFVNIRVKGFFLSGIQARIVQDNKCFTITNLGRKGKTRVNGVVITEQVLKNGDLITCGKSTFKFIESK